MKSKMTIDEFKVAWYHGFDIDADAIENEELRYKYLDVLTSEMDHKEALEALEEYLSGRPDVHASGNADVIEQSNVSGPRLLN